MYLFLVADLDFNGPKRSICTRRLGSSQIGKLWRGDGTGLRPAISWHRTHLHRKVSTSFFSFFYCSPFKWHRTLNIQYLQDPTCLTYSRTYTKDRHYEGLSDPRFSERWCGAKCVHFIGNTRPPVRMFNMVDRPLLPWMTSGPQGMCLINDEMAFGTSRTMDVW